MANLVIEHLLHAMVTGYFLTQFCLTPPPNIVQAIDIRYKIYS